MITPQWLKVEERNLKFQTEALFFVENAGGINPDDISMSKVPSGQDVSPEMLSCINDGWTKAQQEQDQNKRLAYEQERGRYEDIQLVIGGKYKVLWSMNSYKIHAALKDNPKYFDPAKQARLLTVNTILETSDHKIPIAIKNAQKTDQGEIKSLIGVGFSDLKYGNNAEPRIETIRESINRRFKAEISIPDNLVDYDGMRVLDLCDNAVQNFDLDFGVHLSTKVKAGEVYLNKDGDGGKYKEMWSVSNSEKSLLNTIYDFADKPKTSSGHMIANLLSYLAMKHGGRTKESRQIKYIGTVKYLSEQLKSSNSAVSVNV